MKYPHVLVYAIKDNISEQTAPPMTAPNEKTARRMFAGFCQGNGNASDYDLFYLGEYDNMEMKFCSLEPAPKHVCNGLTVVRQENEAIN